eukprot:11845083-Karenia_brevis.AAC.1
MQEAAHSTSGGTDDDIGSMLLSFKQAADDNKDNIVKSVVYMEGSIKDTFTTKMKYINEKKPHWPDSLKRLAVAAMVSYKR